MIIGMTKQSYTMQHKINIKFWDCFAPAHIPSPPPPTAGRWQAGSQCRKHVQLVLHPHHHKRTPVVGIFVFGHQLKLGLFEGTLLVAQLNPVGIEARHQHLGGLIIHFP